MFAVSNRICDDLFDRGGPHKPFPPATYVV